MEVPFGLFAVPADAGSLDCTRSSASGRSFSARDDRVEEGSTSVMEFVAPTFRKGRERWGTPRLWLSRQSAGILRWESLALPRTPLSQDDGHGWAKTVVRQLIRRRGLGLLLSYFQSCHRERRERTRARVRSWSRKTPSTPASALAPERHSRCALVRTSSQAELPSISLRVPADAGPSTAQDRPRAGDLSPLGMTEWRRGQDNRASLVHGAVAMC